MMIIMILILIIILLSTNHDLAQEHAQDHGPDEYLVKVIDANGCEDSILSITINEPLLLQLNVDSIAMNDCFGDQQGYISVLNTSTSI